MRITTISRRVLAAMLLCSHGAWAFHTIPCSDPTIQAAIKSILDEEANKGADAVDYYIALAGGQVYNEPIVINDNGTSGGIKLAISGGHPADANGCAASGDFDGSETVISGGGRFHQSVIQITGHATVYLHRLTLSGAQLGGSGGGISFDGSGSLNLFGVDIANNHAGSGAGIHANGSAPGLGVYFHDWIPAAGLDFINIVESNTATNGSGAGIDLSGETFLTATDGTLIVFGNGASGDGGGIAMHGHGSIQLGQNVQIVQNSAQNGAGLFIDADQQTAVTLSGFVSISGNTAANDGGGVYLSHVDLDAQGADIHVDSNQSLGDAGHGGGLAVFGPATATFSGTINGNTAGYGGGLYAKTGSNDNANINIHLKGNGSPYSVVSIRGNGAVHDGGALYCSAYQNGSPQDLDCTIHANNFSIVNNYAQNGSAVFGESGSAFLGTDWGPTILFDGGGSVCQGHQDCNIISGNFRQGGTAQDGDVISMPAGSRFTAQSVKFQANQGAHLFATHSSNALDRDNAFYADLITDNQVDGVLMDVPEQTLIVRDSTIANNTIGGDTVIRDASSVLFYGNIVQATRPDGSPMDTFDFGSNAGTLGHNIADVLTNAFDGSMKNADGLVLRFDGRPVFVNAVIGDYHLAPFSPAIDVGTDDPNIPFDLDGNSRNPSTDELAVDNRDGPRDLGAYEFVGVLGPPPPCSEAAQDKIFCTQFE